MRRNFNLTKSDIDDIYRGLSSCSIEKVDHRGITINQLQLICDEIEARCVLEGWKDIDGNLLTPERVNLYDIKVRIIMNRTVALQCSYVELVALGEQIPEWYVSYWWGQPVFSVTKCLKRHAKDRRLSWDTPYYIDAYANNHHPGKIAEEMVGNPFLKAMTISKGTLNILDNDCVVYSRIWCIYELYKSLMDKKDGYKFDVYTEHDWEINTKFSRGDDLKDSGDAIGLTDGFIESDFRNGIPNPLYKVLRESQFPLERILNASAIDIKKAAATMAKDEQYIKNIITNQNIDDDPPEHHDNYEKLNNLIRGFFVGSNLQRIIREPTIESDQKSIYFDILRLSSVTVFYLDVRGYKPFDDSVASQLAVSLPSTINSFTFSSDRSSITRHGILTLSRGLASLTTLEVIKLRDNNIDDETCFVIADVIRNDNTLKTLDLDKNNIGDEGAIAIASALRINNNMRKLVLSNNKVNDEGAKILADALTVNHSLNILDVNGNNISTNWMMAIVDALKLSHSNSNDNKNLQEKVNSKLSQLSKVLQTINESEVELRRSKIMIVGEGRTGKTAFANSIMGNDFKETESTVGIDKFMCSVNYADLNKGEWNISDKKIEKEYENAIASVVNSTNDDDDDDHIDWDFDWDNVTPSVAANDISVDHKSSVPRAWSKVPEEINYTASSDVKIEEEQEIDFSISSKENFDKDMIIKYLGVHIKIGENIRIDILDYSGQTVFNIIHQFFLTRYGVYALVFNMEDLIKDNEFDKRQKSLDSIRFWLNSITVYTYDKSEQIAAPIIVIGTRKDKVKDIAEHEQISDILNEEFKNIPAWKSIIKSTEGALCFFPIDNTLSRKDPVMKSVMTEIENCMKSAEYTHKKVPVSWLKTLDEITSLKKSFIAYEEYKSITEQCTVSTKNLSDLLNFFHELGYLIWHDHTGLRDIIILDPIEFFVQPATKIIFDPKVHNRSHSPEQKWDDLTKHGILRSSLLSDLWMDISEHRNFLLNLMCRYGLLVPLLMDVNVSESYIVPSLLSSSEKQHQRQWLDDGAYYQTCYFLFSTFEDLMKSHIQLRDLKSAGFLPNGLFERIVGKAVEWCQLTSNIEQINTNSLFKDLIVLNYGGKSFRLWLREDLNTIRLDVAGMNPLLVYDRVLEQINNCIIESMKSLKVFTALSLNKSTVRKFSLEEGDTLVSIENVQKAVESSIPLSLSSNSSTISVKDLKRKFGPWLKNNKNLSKYDIFVSYYDGAIEQEDKQLVVAMVDMLSNFSYGSKFRDVNIYLGQHADLSQNVKSLSKSTVFIPVFSVDVVFKMIKHDSSTVDFNLMEWICALEGLESKQYSRINAIFPLKRYSSTDKLLTGLTSEEFNQVPDFIPRATLLEAETLLIQLKLFSKAPNGFHSMTIKSIITKISEIEGFDIVDDKSSNLLKRCAKKVIEILKPIDFTEDGKQRDNGRQRDAYNQAVKENQWNEALSLAARRELWDLAERCLSDEANPDFLDQFDEDGLVLACRCKKFDVVLKLLEKGLSPDSVDMDGKSALLWACEKGSDNIAELLIKKGAFINSDDKEKILDNIFKQNLFSTFKSLYDQDSLDRGDLTKFYRKISNDEDLLAEVIKLDFPFVKDEYNQISRNKHYLCMWTEVINVDNDEYFKDMMIDVTKFVESKLEEFNEIVKVLADEVDYANRSALSIASEDVKKVFYKCLFFIERFEFHTGPPVRKSSTSLIILATDHLVVDKVFIPKFNQFKKDNQMTRESFVRCFTYWKTKFADEGLILKTREKFEFDFNDCDLDGCGEISQKEFINYCLKIIEPRVLILKFIKNEVQYQREVNARKNNKLDANFVVNIVDTFDISHKIKGSKHKHLEGEDYKFMITMPAADRNLKDIIEKEKPSDDVKRILLREVAKAIQHLHGNDLLHGDIKALNKVRKGEHNNVNYWSSITMNDELLMKKLNPISDINHSCYYGVRKYNAKSICIDVIPGEFFLVEATASIDIWSFGVLMFYMLSINNQTLFKIDVNDDLISYEDYYKIISWKDRDIVNIIQESIEDKYASDLLMKILKIEPKDRLSFDAILADPYFHKPSRAMHIERDINEIKQGVKKLNESVINNSRILKDMSRKILLKLYDTEKVLKRTILDATEVTVPTTFIILPQKITSERNDDIVINGNQEDANEIVKLINSLAKVWKNATASIGYDVVYMYLIDEYSKTPVIPDERDEIYPIEIEVIKNGRFLNSVAPYLATGFKFVSKANSIAEMIKYLGFPTPTISIDSSTKEFIQLFADGNSVGEHYNLSNVLPSNDPKNDSTIHNTRGAALRELKIFFKDKDPNSTFCQLRRVVARRPSYIMWTTDENFKVMESDIDEEEELAINQIHSNQNDRTEIDQSSSAIPPSLISNNDNNDNSSLITEQKDKTEIDTVSALNLNNNDNTEGNNDGNNVGNNNNFSDSNNNDDNKNDNNVEEANCNFYCSSCRNICCFCCG